VELTPHRLHKRAGNPRLGNVRTTQELHMRTFITFVIALLISTAPASAATITFSGLLTPSAFTTYTEAGFTVSATSGSWEAITSFGTPAPFIEFLREADEPEISAQIEITA